MKAKTPLLKYIFALLLFGLNGVVASHINLSSYEIVLTRTLIGSLLLIAVFALSRQKVTLFKNKRHALCQAASGVAMGVHWMFLYEAYRQIGVSIATLACYCVPVIVMMLSPLVFREKLTWVKLAGFAAVLAGMFFINTGAAGGGSSAWGIFCGVMSAVTYALMVIFNKKAKSVTGLENAMWQLLTAFLTVAVFVGVKEGFTIRIDSGSWVPILVLGLVNTGFGCYLYFSAISALKVQTVSVCGYLEPLSAVFFSMLFLHETMAPVQIIGAVLILGGAAFAELFCARSTSASINTRL
jgi:drug/metabolite transporter (DMT)-like permease